MVTYINLTPHDFTVRNKHGELITFPPTNYENGVLSARVDMISEDVTHIVDRAGDFSIFKTHAGNLQFEVLDPQTRQSIRILTEREASDWHVQLRRSQRGIYFIVSMAVAPAMKRAGYNVVVGAKMLKTDDGTMYQTGFAIPD